MKVHVVLRNKTEVVLVFNHLLEGNDMEDERCYWLEKQRRDGQQYSIVEADLSLVEGSSK